MTYNCLHSWKLWYHSPSNSDWSVNSYGKISDIDNVETCKTICQKHLNENLLTSCMFLL